MSADAPAHRVILDCDPGQDDAVAMLLALGSAEEMEVLAVTTVAGNVPLARTTGNALAVLALADRPDIPVHAGCRGPMLRPLLTAEHVHGETGLDGAELPAPLAESAPGHGVDALIEILMREPAGSVTLVPTGPLTNIAMAMVKEPEILPRIREIALMGGAIAEGNVTPAAEFNFHVDPHAAKVVFRSGVPLTMLGLDVTHKALTTEAELGRLRALETRAGEAAAGLLDFYNRFDRERYSRPGGPLHDPCAVAWLLRPEIFTGKRCHVAIETEGLCAGRSVVDWWLQTDGVPNARVIRELDAAAFFDLLLERIGRLG